MHANNASALCSSLLCLYNIIAYPQRKAKSSEKKRVQPEIKLPLLFVLFVLASSAQNSGPAKRLSLKVMALNNLSKRLTCSRNPAHITLDFVNGSMPQCSQTDMKELCFPHRDTSNPHIIENRFPGVLRQLRRLTRLNVCPNYTISYSVESGKTLQMIIANNDLLPAD